MDGVGLALWISQQRPGVDVVLTSGYPHDSQAVGAKVFLPKPYRLPEVVFRIRALLDDWQRAE